MTSNHMFLRDRWVKKRRKGAKRIKIRVDDCFLLILRVFLGFATIFVLSAFDVL